MLDLDFDFFMLRFCPLFITSKKNKDIPWVNPPHPVTVKVGIGSFKNQSIVYPPLQGGGWTQDIFLNVHSMD